MMVGPFFAPSVQAAYPEPTNEFYVLDEENVLSAETEAFIIQVNKQYEQTEEGNFYIPEEFTFTRPVRDI